MTDARDIELRIKARNASLQTFEQVSNAVSKLTAQLDEQVKAAARGEASFKELEATLSQLAKLDQALGRQAGAVAGFKELSAQLDQQVAAAARSREAFQQLDASLAGVSQRKRSQNAEFKAARDTMNEDERAVRRSTAALEKLSAFLVKSEVDTRNLAAAEEALAQVEQRVGAARQTANQAVTSLPAQQRATQAAIAALREEEQAQQRVAAAQQKRAQEAATFAAAQAAQVRAKREAELVAVFTPVIDKQEAEERLRKDAADFRAKAKAAFSSLQNPSVSIAADSGVASSVEKIVAPAANARRSLIGLEQEVTKLAAQAAQGGQPIQAYADTLRRLEAAQRALVTQSGVIDAFRAQVAAVRQLRAEFEKQRAAGDVTGQLSGQMATAVAKAKELQTQLRGAGIDTSKLAEATNRLRASAQATVPAAERLGKVVREGVSPGGAPTLFGLRPYQLQNLSFQINDVFTQIASGTSVTQTLAQQGGQILQIFPNAFSNLLKFLPGIVAIGTAAVAAFASVNRLLETQAALRSFQGQLAASADGSRFQAGALVEAQRAAERYGTAFNEAGEAIRTFLREGVAPERLQTFLKLTQDIVDVYGGKFPDVAKQVAEAFTGNTDALLKLNEQYNVLSGNAAQAVLDAVKEGDMNRARTIVLDAFVKAMDAGAAQARGPWTEAARAFTAAWNQMLESLGNSRVVAGAVDVLTAAIKGWTIAIKGAGAAGVARQIAEETAAIAQAQGLLAQLERRPSREQAAGTTREQLRQDIERRYALIDALKKQQDAQQQTAAGTGSQADAQDKEAASRNRVTAATTAQTEAGKRALQQQNDELFLKRKLDTLNRQEIERRIQITRLQAEEDFRKKTTDENLVRQAGQNAADAERLRIQEELAKKGEAAAKREMALAQELAAFLRQTEAKITRGTAEGLDERLALFDTNINKMLAKVEEFRKSGGKIIEGIPIDQFVDRLKNAVAELRQLEEVKFFADTLKDISRGRADFTRTVAEEIKTGTISVAEGLDQLRKNAALVGPEMVKTAQSIIALGEAQEKAGKLTPQIALDMARARAVLNSQGAAGGDGATSEQQVVAAVEAGLARINVLAQTRQNIISEQKSLVDNYATSEVAAEEAIRAAYEKTTPEILKQVEALRAQLEAAKESGAISGAAYDLLAAKLANVTAQANYLSPALKEVLDATKSAFASEGTTFFKSVAQALGGLVTGTKSLSQAFRAAGQAAATFFANFLAKIAEAIIQAYLLRTITAALGGGGGGGDIFGTVLKAVIKHDGGLVGAGAGPTRQVSPYWFTNAPRFHSGGLPGLRSDEVPAILQRGEEVLTRDSPRNVRNWGRGDAGKQQDISIRNVLVTDPNMVTDALQTPAGERVVLSIIRANAGTVRSMVGNRG